MKTNVTSHSIIEQGNCWEIDGKWDQNTIIDLHFDMPGYWVRLPHNDTVRAIMRGPVVLARSSIHAGERMDEPLLAPDLQTLKLLEKEETLEKPGLQFELLCANGKKVFLSDYASIGKDFEKPNDPQATKQMLANRVGVDQRVWFKIN